MTNHVGNRIGELAAENRRLRERLEKLERAHAWFVKHLDNYISIEDKCDCGQCMEYAQAKDLRL